MKRLSLVLTMAFAMILTVPALASAQGRGFHGGNSGHMGGVPHQVAPRSFNGGHNGGYSGGYNHNVAPRVTPRGDYRGYNPGNRVYTPGNRVYNPGYNPGYNRGYDRGYDRGYNRGYDRDYRGFVRGDYGRDYRGAWRGLPFRSGYGFRGWYGMYNGIWGFYGPEYIPAYGLGSITVYEQVAQTSYDPYTGQYVYTGGVTTVIHVAYWDNYYGGYVYTDSYGRLQVVR